MTDTITLTGIVATDPRHIITSEGLAITHFRLASPQRRFDKSQERWVDADTNWYTVTTFRQLAINASNSLKKGERVVATGRVRIREWDNGERKGTAVDLEADSLGHDLTFGSSSFTRSITSTPVSVPDEFPSAAASAQGDSVDEPATDTLAGQAAGSTAEQPVASAPLASAFVGADQATPF